MYSPLPTLHAIGNLPKILINETLLTAHNKKITPQRRLYATRNELKIFHEKIVSRNEATRWTCSYRCRDFAGNNMLPIILSAFAFNSCMIEFSIPDFNETIIKNLISLHSRFPPTRSSSIGVFSATSARGNPSIPNLLCASHDARSQRCHVNNCMHVLENLPD